MRTTTYEQWLSDAKARFGDNAMDWRFECPVCHHVASVKDWRDAKAPEGAVAFSCVGAYTNAPARKAFEEGGTGPCNYAGGGLFKLNPVTVTGGPGGDHTVFEFASAEATS